jgi:hypothetical protein
MEEWVAYQWITSIEECPNCNRQLLISKASFRGLKDSMNELIKSAKLHKKYCSGEKYKKIHFPVKINIKMENATGYKSVWKDNNKIYL